MKAPRTHPHFLALASLAGAAFAASCSSGSGSGGAALVEEDYSVDSFDYVDPSPPPPFLRTRTELRVRDEVALVAPGKVGRVFDFHDGEPERAYRTRPEFRGLEATDFLDLTAGRVDADADEDLVACYALDTAVGGSCVVLLYAGAPGNEAPLTWSHLASVRAHQPSELRLATGDLDADGLDETVVAYRSRRHGGLELLVVDDAEAGGALLHSVVFPHEPDGELGLIVANLGGDDTDDVVLYTLRDEGVALELFDPDDPSTALDDLLLPAEPYEDSISVVAGHFDEECRCAELLVLYQPWGEDEHPFGPKLTRLQQVELTEGALTKARETALPALDGRYQGFVAVDFEGDFVDELVFHRPGLAGGVYWTDPKRLLREPSWNEPWARRVEGGPPASFRSETLAAGDQDADGCWEAAVVWRGPEGRAMLTRVEWDAELERLTQLVTNEWDELAAETRVLFGDFDGDSTVVRYTGERRLVVGEPVPVVVMAAPPWKWGAAQDLDAMSTGFSFAGGQADDGLALEAGTTLTARPGEFAPVDAHLRRSVTHQLERTATVPAVTQYEDGEATGWDHDLVSFSGTLYQCYRYEVVAEKRRHRIGNTVTVDVPVASTCFCWSVEDYNRRFEPDIDPLLLQHTVGDPTSYMTRKEARALLDRYEGALSPAQRIAGAWGGAERAALHFGPGGPNAWSSELPDTSGYRAGPIPGGVSASAVDGCGMQDVAPRAPATFVGRIGSMPPGYDAAYGYGYALLVYTKGKYCAGSGLEGYEPDVAPCQVVTYATVPYGGMYPDG